MANPRRIYVGGLNYDTNESKIRDRFEEFGRIVTVDKKKGYGFIVRFLCFVFFIIFIMNLKDSLLFFKTLMKLHLTGIW